MGVVRQRTGWEDEKKSTIKNLKTKTHWQTLSGQRKLDYKQPTLAQRIFNVIQRSQRSVCYTVIAKRIESVMHSVISIN